MVSIKFHRDKKLTAIFKRFISCISLIILASCTWTNGPSGSETNTIIKSEALPSSFFAFRLKNDLTPEPGFNRGKPQIIPFKGIVPFLTTSLVGIHKKVVLGGDQGFLFLRINADGSYIPFLNSSIIQPIHLNKKEEPLTLLRASHVKSLSDSLTFREKTFFIGESKEAKTVKHSFIGLLDSKLSKDHMFGEEGIINLSEHFERQNSPFTISPIFLQEQPKTKQMLILGSTVHNDQTQNLFSMPVSIYGTVHSKHLTEFSSTDKKLKAKKILQFGDSYFFVGDFTTNTPHAPGLFVAKYDRRLNKLDPSFGQAGFVFIEHNTASYNTISASMYNKRIAILSKAINSSEKETYLSVTVLNSESGILDKFFSGDGTRVVSAKQLKLHSFTGEAEIHTNNSGLIYVFFGGRIASNPKKFSLGVIQFLPNGEPKIGYGFQKYLDKYFSVGSSNQYIISPQNIVTHNGYMLLTGTLAKDK